MEQIGLDDLKKRLDAGDLALFDVRGDDEYEKEHIPGAKSAPLSSLGTRVSDVTDESTEVALYGAGEGSDLRERAAEALQHLGQRKVYEFTEGLKGWKEAGLDTVRRS